MSRIQIFFWFAVFVLFHAFAGATRGNYCVQQRNRTAGEVQRKLLQGTHPTLAFVDNAAPAYFYYDPVLKRPTSGFLFKLFEQMALNGGFQWNYTLTPRQGSVPDDYYLRNITLKYDTVAKTSFDTAFRRQLGMSFTPPLLDASLVLIINTNTVRFILGMYLHLPFVFAILLIVIFRY